MNANLAMRVVEKKMEEQMRGWESKMSANEMKMRRNEI